MRCHVQERINGGSEPLFIKNLENVQGDERDVVFISGTYGPDAKGNQYKRFGPINGPNGHRRLNVLFTRAKMRTEVFHSSTRIGYRLLTQAPGGYAPLRQLLLNYARDGSLEAPDEGGLATH